MIYIQLLFAPASESAIPGSSALGGLLRVATEPGDASTIEFTHGNGTDRRRFFIPDDLAEDLVAAIRDLTGNPES